MALGREAGTNYCGDVAVGLPRPTPPSWLLDFVLAAALTAAIAIAISVAPAQDGPPTAAAYVLAPVVGILALFRNRWPLAVLLASAVSVQVYNLYDNPGIFAAVPLSVALAPQRCHL